MNNDVKCGFEMLHEVGLTLEKCRANHIECNMNFSTFDVIIGKVYWQRFFIARTAGGRRIHTDRIPRHLPFQMNNREG